MQKHRTHDAGQPCHLFEKASTAPDLRLYQKEVYFICGILRRKGQGTAMYFAVRLSGKESKRLADIDKALGGANGNGDALRAERARLLGREYYFKIARDGEHWMNQRVESYPTEWQPYA